MLNKLTALSFTTFVLAELCSVHAFAQVDQSQLIDNRFVARFRQGGIAQSFQQFHNTFTGASFKLQPNEGTVGDITISLYNALPNTGGTLLASGTALGVPAGAFATVNFSTINIVPDTTYFLVLTSSNGDLGLAGGTNNPYARGQSYSNTGFGSFPAFDYTFQTYYSAASVPEATTTMFSIALLSSATLFKVCRNRRNKRFASL